MHERQQYETPRLVASSMPHDDPSPAISQECLPPLVKENAIVSLTVGLIALQLALYVLGTQVIMLQHKKHALEPMLKAHAMLGWTRF